MLRTRDVDEWLEWQHFLSLEPLPSRQQQWQFAHLIKVIRDLTRGKNAAAVKLEDMLLKFGDEANTAPTRKQSWQEQKAIWFQAMRELVRKSPEEKARAARPQRPPRERRFQRPPQPRPERRRR